MTIRILLADDHPVLRAGIGALIAIENDMNVIAEACDGAQAVALFETHAPDVMLMDLRMPVMNGIEAIRTILTTHPSARIVALTSYEGDADIFRALDAGACGYLLKDMLGKELVNAVRTVASGKRAIPSVVASRLAEFTPRIELTLREVDVLRNAAKGLRNKEIAHVMGRSEETVKVHLKHLMAKLDASDRTEAVMIALRRGIIHLDDYVRAPGNYQPSVKYKNSSI